MSIESLLVRSWYGHAKWTKIFLPMMPFINRAIEKKREKFLADPALSYTASVPVIIVGNISVGGTGKSPMVIALSNWLRKQGYKPGIVSRGHNMKPISPIFVTSSSRASEVGDEPAMLSRRTKCPIVVFPKRVDAIKYLLSQSDVNVIICDDGMQHYMLNRDIEIAMIDAQRGLGNGQLLPVGPLREPINRLESVDFIVSITDKLTPKLNELNYPVVKTSIHSPYLASLDETRSQTFDKAFKNNRRWHVIAGIGNPGRFLDTLKSLGLNNIASVRWFIDHYIYCKEDIPALDSVIMTEKDAIKCRDLSVTNPDIWYLPVSLILPDSFKIQLLTKLQHIKKEKHHE